MREVAIIGAGLTRFGELWETSFRNLITDAGMKAIVDCKVTGEDIDALYVGSMSSGQFVNQELVAPLVLDSAGLADSHIPTTRVEGAGASGGMAFRQAFLAVASGQVDVAIAGGVEKMTDVPERELTKILGAASDQEWEAFLGATDPALHALIAKRHMEKHGTTREQLARVAVQNHKHGAQNPNAQFQKEIKLDTVLASPLIADPLRVFDAAPASDGAAAVILCPLEEATSYTNRPVRIAGSGQGSDYLGLASRESLVTFEATKYAARWAYKSAGIEAKDVDVCEVHDSYTINQLLAIEDLGFCKKGEGGLYTERGETALTGKHPVNPSGGLKARGHPLGATGIAQICELTWQLRRESGPRQVKNAQWALAQNTGGTGAAAVVHILEAVR
ncbi:MAG TPA: thiolase domain-containing protein [Candidatus Thermoplasmatota archaeon]|nr:thiolase domain-containing protein [Candidatus Thermoplasmatota archaeon]